MAHEQFFSNNKLREYVTPHKIGLLLLVREYCIIRRKMKLPPSQPGDNLSDIEITYTEREMRDFMVTLLKLLQSGDMELVELANKIKSIMRSKMYEIFMREMKVICQEGIIALMDFFQQLPDVLLQDNTPCVTRTSVVGLFLRRMTLSFEKLSFSQVTRLFIAFKQYYKDWEDICGEESNQTLEESMMDVTDMSDPDTSCPVILHDKKYNKQSFVETGCHSQRQAEYFISQQSHLLQHNPLAALPPAKLQGKITEFLKSNPDLAEVHYLSYLNSLRLNEYCGAINSIYHYFERLSIGGTTTATKDSSTTNNNNNKKEDEPTKAYRYAILNIAALHFKFGHREESLAALQEAITIAQEYNDNICLQHALGWLHRLGEQNTLNTANLLERAVTKSNELHLPYLTSLGIQAFAKHSALNCVPPGSVFEFIMKSDIVNCQQSQLDLMAISYAQKAAMWHMYGNRLLSSMNSQMLLHLNTSDAGIYMGGESGCIAMCNLARHHANEGLYSAAFDILDACKVHFPTMTEHSKIWMLCEQMIIFDRAMHHGKINLAEQATLNIAAINSVEAKYRQAYLLKEKGETSAALSIVNEIMDIQHKDIDEATPDLFARVTLVYAELYCQTSNVVAAISPLLSCLTFCRRHHFRHLAAMATAYLGYVQFCMNLASQALKTIESQLLSVLTHGSVCDKARVLFLYTKCQIASAKRESQAARRTALQQALSILNTVVELFQKVEDYRRIKDVYYFQARLYNELGYTAERNKCALEFKQLDQHYPTISKLNVNIL